jgi:hypothetical protein
MFNDLESLNNSELIAVTRDIFARWDKDFSLTQHLPDRLSQIASAFACKYSEKKM